MKKSKQIADLTGKILEMEKDIEVLEEDCSTLNRDCLLYSKQRNQHQEKCIELQFQCNELKKQLAERVGGTDIVHIWIDECCQMDVDKTPSSQPVEAESLRDECLKYATACLKPVESKTVTLERALWETEKKLKAALAERDYFEKSVQKLRPQADRQCNQCYVFQENGLLKDRNDALQKAIANTDKENLRLMAARDGFKSQWETQRDLARKAEDDLRQVTADLDMLKRKKSDFLYGRNIVQVERELNDEIMRLGQALKTAEHTHQVFMNRNSELAQERNNLEESYKTIKEQLDVARKLDDIKSNQIAEYRKAINAYPCSAEDAKQYMYWHGNDVEKIELLQKRSNEAVSYRDNRIKELLQEIKRLESRNESDCASLKRALANKDGVLKAQDNIIAASNERIIELESALNQIKDSVKPSKKKTGKSTTP